MTGWVHESLAQRVRFADGEAAAGVRAEMDALGASRVMLIAGEHELDLARRVTDGLPVALTYDEVVMHVPVEVAERARTAAGGSDADVLVSIGGGSTTGLAKAVALTTGLPIIAVPTTYAGSEATNVWGLTSNGEKKTGSDPRVLPRSIVYDASLTTTLPVELSVASGLNALAHCVDSMWAPRTDPIDQALSLEGMRALRAALPRVVEDAKDSVGRERMLYGAYLAAVAFASAGSGLHHKICHVLGGMFDLPHAQTHAVVLPHVLAFNAPHATAAQERMASAFAAPSALEGMRALYERVAAPRALRDFGMPQDGIERAAAAIVKAAPGDNPTPVTEENITALLHDAWEGRTPHE